MSERPLKLGFVGGGLNSAIGRVHYSAALMDGLFRVECGVFSRNRQICRSTAERYCFNADKGYASLNEMLSKESLDAIVVMTPTPNHSEILKSLASYDVGVICEKPLVSSLAEWAELTAGWNNSRDLFVTYNYTGYPMVREAQSILAEKSLGRVLHVIVEMPNDGFLRPPKIGGRQSPPQSWRLNDGTIPHAALDLATHALQLIRFVTCDEISNATGKFSNQSKFPDLNDTFRLFGDLTRGAEFSLWTTKTALGYRNGLNLRVHCERGSLRWDQSDPEHLFVTDSQGISRKHDRSVARGEAAAHRYDRFKVGHPAGYIEAFANYYADIFNVLSGNDKEVESRKFLFTINDALVELSILEGIVLDGKYKRTI